MATEIEKMIKNVNRDIENYIKELNDKNQYLRIKLHKQEKELLLSQETLEDYVEALNDKNNYIKELKDKIEFLENKVVVLDRVIAYKNIIIKNKHEIIMARNKALDHAVELLVRFKEVQAMIPHNSIYDLRLKLLHQLENWKDDNNE